MQRLESVLDTLQRAVDAGDLDGVKRAADSLDRAGGDPVEALSRLALSESASPDQREMALKAVEALDSSALRRITRGTRKNENVKAARSKTKWIAALVALAVLWPVYSIYRFNNTKRKPPSAKSSESVESGRTGSSTEEPATLSIEHRRTPDVERKRTPDVERKWTPSVEYKGASDVKYRRITADHYLGCTDREYHDKITSYAVQGDLEAFRQAISIGINAGVCTQFKLGDKVYVTDTAILSGLVRVRRVGETEEFWTNIEAVK